MTEEPEQDPAGGATVVRSPPTSDAPEIPDVEIVTTLGEGGMGIVYLGKQRLVGDNFRKVAVKTILGSYAEDEIFRKKFINEVGRHSQLEHPNILSVYGAGESAQCLFMLVAFASDGSLRERMLKGRLDVTETIRIVREIAEALDYIHNQEEPVVHLDIKPENILFQANNPLLADFGVAKQIVGTKKTNTLVAGDPRYWAPEQADNNPCDKSDIYSLGVVFLEMLLGSTPPLQCKLVYSDKDRDAIIKELPDDAKIYGPLIARCLASEPDARPTPAELLDGLEALRRRERRPKLWRLGTIAALALLTVYFAASQTAQERAIELWKNTFPLPQQKVSFTISPTSAELWIDGQEQSFRRAELTEEKHHVVVVANDHLGEHRIINVTTPETISFELIPRPAITDAEYLDFSNKFGVTDEVLDQEWTDQTLRNLVQLERMEKGRDPALEQFVNVLKWLADAGDTVAQTTLFYAAFEGLPVAGSRMSFLPGLDAASASGYPLATILKALHIIQDLRDRNMTFDENAEAFVSVTTLLRTAKYQGLPQTADTFAAIVNAELD